MIRTHRLVLRPARDDDFWPLHQIMSNARAMRYWDRPPHTPEHTRAFLRGLMDSDSSTVEYIVEHEGQVIGRVGMWRVAEVGYIFHPDVWGKGFGAEAVGALCTDVFARFPDIHQITADIDPRNAASDGLLRKLGFRETGKAERTTQVAGEWSDSVFFALDRPG